ncbi:hypothetical protein H5410_062770 [Solanum commersonii]|uniref:Uncharacterized protein n=1 Tax=Solanum commersonii TaxID=4109 RepID=A0A9J5WCH6_SOLCO|nr:hypothetical protein H5410_062770 [Solanum commersonii]
MISLTNRAQAHLHSLSLFHCSKLTDTGLKHVLDKNLNLSKESSVIHRRERRVREKRTVSMVSPIGLMSLSRRSFITTSLSPRSSVGLMHLSRRSFINNLFISTK